MADLFALFPAFYAAVIAQATAPAPKPGLLLGENTQILAWAGAAMVLGGAGFGTIF